MEFLLFWIYRSSIQIRAWARAHRESEDATEYLNICCKDTKKYIALLKTKLNNPGG